MNILCTKPQRKNAMKTLTTYPNIPDHVVDPEIVSSLEEKKDLSAHLIVMRDTDLSREIPE